MNALGACLLGAATFGSAALTVSGAVAQPVAGEAAPTTVFANAAAPTVVPLPAAQPGCVDVSVRGERGRRFVLSVFDAAGRLLAPAATGIGGVSLRACGNDGLRRHALVQASADGPVEVTTGPYADAVPSPSDATPIAEAAELGPGATFVASRRLSAAIAGAEELGYEVVVPAFDLTFDRSGATSIPLPTSPTCVSLRIEVDDGAIRFEGGPVVESGAGAAFAVCGTGRAFLGARVLSGAPRVRAVWMGSRSVIRGAAATRPEVLAGRVGAEARGLSPRTLALVVPNGAAIPVPLDRPVARCFSLAAVATGHVELTLTDAQGRLVARAVSASPAPAVYHCPVADEALVAWVRAPRADEPIRLVIGEEVSP